MSPGDGVGTKAASGMFGPVTGPGGASLDATSISYKGGSRERSLVDEDEIPAEFAEPVGADHFVIYGKASVEEYDEDGQRVDVDALEGAKEQLFNSGNISRRHKDVRVGEPLPSWELEDDLELEIDGERFAFEAGDELATGANPEVVQGARSGEADDDEFWIVADLWADTEIAKDTRLRALTGDLDGFSVTIYAKETEPTPDGEDVTDLDWHAVTIGPDEAIKNKGSRFGLADFKAMFGRTDDGAPGGRATRSDRPSTTMLEGLLEKAGVRAGLDGEKLSAAAGAARKAQNDGVPIEEAAADAADGTSFKAEAIAEAASVLDADMKAASEDDLEEILVGVEAGDLSAEEALDMVADAGAVETDDEGDNMEDNDNNDDGGDPGDIEEGGMDEQMVEEKLDEMLDEKLDERIDEKMGEEHDDGDDEDYVTEDELDEKMDAVVDTVGQKLDESVPTSDEIAEKMETGSTGSPAAGSGRNDRDIAAEMKAAFGGDGE